MPLTHVYCHLAHTLTNVWSALLVRILFSLKPDTRHMYDKTLCRWPHYNVETATLETTKVGSCGSLTCSSSAGTVHLVNLEVGPTLGVVKKNCHLDYYYFSSRNRKEITGSNIGPAMAGQTGCLPRPCNPGKQYATTEIIINCLLCAIIAAQIAVASYQLRV